MPKKKTQEDFVAELKVTHPNLNVLGNYVGDKKYVDVFCTIHNYKFRTKPNWLHRGSNCKKCYYERRGKMLRKDTDTLKKNYLKSITIDSNTHCLTRNIVITNLLLQ